MRFKTSRSVQDCQQVGKLLWMSQLRDDQHPMEELSRSLSNPQNADFSNLEHLLKHVNQMRDCMVVMDPQVPTSAFSGLIPVQIVCYSDSDWAGCQKTRRSKSGSLLTRFGVNMSSTSIAQSTVSRLSTEAEVYRKNSRGQRAERF